jgi:hypothetical protein
MKKHFYDNRLYELIDDYIGETIKNYLKDNLEIEVLRDSLDNVIVNVHLEDDEICTTILVHKKSE